MFDEKTIAILKRPFPPDLVQFRIGRFPKGSPPEGATARTIALAFISARDVMDRLDEAFGVGGWSCEHEIVFSPQGKCANTCKITIEYGQNDGYCFVADCAEETQIEGIKGAASDAFKRAAVKLGVFRYAYELGETWCTVVYKNGYWHIPDEELLLLQKMLPSPDGYVTPSAVDTGPQDIDNLKDNLLRALKVKVDPETYSHTISQILDRWGKWNDMSASNRSSVIDFLAQKVKENS